MVASSSDDSDTDRTGIDEQMKSLVLDIAEEAALKFPHDDLIKRCSEALIELEKCGSYRMRIGAEPDRDILDQIENIEKQVANSGDLVREVSCVYLSACGYALDEIEEVVKGKAVEEEEDTKNDPKGPKGIWDDIREADKFAEEARERMLLLDNMCSSINMLIDRCLQHLLKSHYEREKGRDGAQIDEVEDNNETTTV